MTSNHSIVPSPEQVRQWEEDWRSPKVKDTDVIGFVANQAAKWASDEELEACRLWVSENCSIYDARALSLIRRPIPTVSKQSAIVILDEIDEKFNLPAPQYNILFNALCQLPE
jgi:hypothetical protein